MYVQKKFWTLFFCDSLPYLNVNSKFEYYMLKWAPL